MENRYLKMVEDCVRASTEGSGELSVAIRRQILTALDAPGLLREFVRNVAYKPSTITQADIDALLKDGFSEDQIFEAGVQAATAAALQRVQAALKAMEANDVSEESR